MAHEINPKLVRQFAVCGMVDMQHEVLASFDKLGDAIAFVDATHDNLERFDQYDDILIRGPLGGWHVPETDDAGVTTHADETKVRNAIEGILASNRKGNIFDNCPQCGKPHEYGDDYYCDAGEVHITPPVTDTPAIHEFAREPLELTLHFCKAIADDGKPCGGLVAITVGDYYGATVYVPSPKQL